MVAVCVLLSAPLWLTLLIGSVVSVALVVSWFFENPKEDEAEAGAES